MRLQILFVSIVLTLVVFAAPATVSAASLDAFLQSLKNLENISKQAELKEASEFKDEGGKKAIYLFYRDGKLMGKTENITQSAALYNCKKNIELDPTHKTKCVWDGDTIHTAKKQKKEKKDESLTCTLMTNKKEYRNGEFIEFIWSTSGKDYTKAKTSWIQNGAAETLELPTGERSYTGNEFYRAQGTGEMTVSLELTKDGNTTTCSTDFTIGEGKSVTSGATVIGIEEGIYERRPGKNKIETTYGTTTVHISPDAGLMGEPLTLVLTARNATAWIIDNPANISIAKIIASGRGLQLVVGAPTETAIEYHSKKAGSDGPHTYKGSGQSYDNLVSWLRGKNIWVKEFISGGKVSGLITI